jgi:hypothetical protein
MFRAARTWGARPTPCDYCTACRCLGWGELQPSELVLQAASDPYDPIQYWTVGRAPQRADLLWQPQALGGV